MKYRIGKTISVIGDTIGVLLENCSANETGEEFGVPDAMCINLPSPTGPIPLMIGQPGSFVDVSIPTGSLLCMVTGIKMTESNQLSSEIKNALESGELVISSTKRVLEVLAVGTITPDGSFERGTDVLPTVSADVYAVDSETIEKVYASYAKGNFSVGRLSVLPSQEAKINLDSFLCRHAAILGQTGSGKSWTVASVLQKIACFPQSSVVLLDLHGEYENAFGEYATYVSASEIELPYWLMNSEELMGLCVDRRESAAPNQIAKFKELLQNAKESHPENIALGIPKITIDTPIYFDFEKIIKEFERLDTEKVIGSQGRPVNGPLYGQFTRLLMRIQSRLNDKRFDLIFKPKTYTTSASMETLFRKILGEESEPKKIVILDLSPVPFDVRSSVISLILRCLFDFAYWYKRKNGKAYPLSVFADEAHSYLNDYDVANEPSRVSSERIAKEGRKYGISLTVISQRPREVSSTILSQCNSFLCLRISNPDDQNYVKNLLPDSMKGIVDIFSTLRRGEAILIGDAVMMPTRIKIDQPDPKPDSDDISFIEEWNKPHAFIDVASVLDIWRKQIFEKDGGNCV
ncbi:MAG: ATP-binding protein [Bacillota bacterium]|jgi:DNA helicase HerA-like ATPase